VAVENLPRLFNPPPVAGSPSNPPKAYALDLRPAPEPDNRAHTHLVTHQVGDPEPRKPASAPMKQKIRAEVAKSLRIVFRR
jgi:hypothetical protein